MHGLRRRLSEPSATGHSSSSWAMNHALSSTKGSGSFVTLYMCHNAHVLVKPHCSHLFAVDPLHTSPQSLHQTGGGQGPTRERWSMDFLAARLEDTRMFRIPTVPDQ